MVRIPIHVKNTYAQTSDVRNTDPPRAPIRNDRPFHLMKEEYARHSLAYGREQEYLTERDETLMITRFVAELQSTAHIGVGRANKIVFTLTRWQWFLGELSTNGIADIYQRWGNPSTKMLTTYGHLTDADLDHELLKVYGVSPTPTRSSHSMESLHLPDAARSIPQLQSIAHCAGIDPLFIHSFPINLR